MSDIPEDVMQAARAWTSGWQKNGGYDDNHMEAIRVTIARAILAERERIAKRIEKTYRNEEGEALRATFVMSEAKDDYLQAWHQASDVADFVRYNPEPK